MKKTIYTTLALLAATVANAADFTSSSVISATTSAFPAVGADVNLFNSMSGATSSAVADAVGSFSYNNNTYNYIAGVGNYSASGLSKSITLSSLTNGSGLDASLILESYSFITRSDNSVSNDIYMQVTVGGQTYTSSVVSYDTAATGGSDTFGVGTFSFAEQNIRLDKDTAYAFQVVDAQGANVDSVRYGVAKTNYFTIGGVKQGYSIDGTTPGEWMPVISIATHTAPAIPEPATATLSLLALAGLAARRRRK